MLRSDHPVTRTLAEVATYLGVEISDDAATIECSGCVTGSNDTRPGDLFIAAQGLRVHAAKFAKSAIENGAVAMVTDEIGAELIHCAGGSTVPILVAENIEDRVAELAAFMNGNPADRLTAFGVTGTNGKTTTAFMVDGLLQALGHRVGLFGTVMTRFGDTVIPSVLTTPPPAELQSMLQVLEQSGATDLVMEVSSHALEQGRTGSMRYAAAGFTNLTHDHLDYHATIEEYFAAKKLLFAAERCEVPVIVIDDEWGERLYRGIRDERPTDRVLAVSTRREMLSGFVGWQVRNPRPFPGGSSFIMEPVGIDGDPIATKVMLSGDFNVANAALAIAMLNAAGVDAAELREVCESRGVDAVVPGRMERLSDAPRVVVDFAHNEAALELAIDALGSSEGRLIVLTGSAGDRDREKRPGMGRIVAERADLTVITDDDPHSEDPAQIRAEIIAGIPDGCEYLEIGDRAEAIRYAISIAEEHDTVLLAGRGHETIQDVDGVMVELDDRVVAREALQGR